VAEQLRGHVPVWFADTIRFFVGASGALILLTAITTSISGFSRLAYSLGEHGQLPRAFGRLHRRTLVSPQAIAAAALITCGIVAATTITHHDVTFLASLFSFGVLIAFTATQVAVIKLRITAPDLPRPYRAPLIPAVVGAVLTFAIWIVALVTHPAARYAGPAWLLAGLVVYISVRLSHGEGLTERVISPDEQVFEDVPHFRRILVPMKIGIIGEEMAATAIKLASEHGAAVEALHVIEVPLDRPLDAPMDDAEERAAASIAEAKLLGNELGVDVIGTILRARSIGKAIVEHARETEADLIVLGSSPRWRRQSRFFSPTVDYVLRRAPCEVLIVAFPQRVLDEELAAT
jgi:nucleotide-binding universal stress UspA family protein